MRADFETVAKFASVYAGFVFGVYWIPLRALDAAGFPGSWSTVALNAIPLLLVLPVMAARWRSLATGGWRFHVGCILLGTAYACYASGFLFTRIVNVIVLFYLMPLWGFLLARVVIGERITPVRWLSLLAGFGGIYLIFGADGTRLPLPKTIGDWMALASGILWAAGSLTLLLDKKGRPIDCGLAFILWGTLAAAVISLTATAHGLLAPPRLEGALNALAWLIPVSIFLVLPGAFATVLGPMVLNPGVVGILFMTEISIGTLTAALLTDEPFGLRHVLGICVITLAGVLETMPAIVGALGRRAASTGERPGHKAEPVAGTGNVED